MSNLNDVAGGANLFNGQSYSFTTDRFCNLNSAIYFNEGYLQVPTGVYFNGDFTLTVWIQLKSYQSFSRIIDFGNSFPSDNVVITMYSGTSNLSGYIFSGSSYSGIDTSSLIQLNQWYHVAFVLSGTTGYIYVDGIQVATSTMFQPKNVNRTRNFIGKSSNPDQNPDAIYDDLKIYIGAMSPIEVLNEYNTSTNYS